MEPTPVQISYIRLRLHAIKAFSSELVNLLDEIDEMGEFSRQLIPDLIGAMGRGVYFPPTPLVNIIARLKSAELLDAAVEQYEGEWSLNTFDRCALLIAGFLQYQNPLLEELFQTFENDTEPRRSAIVEALSVSGTAAALETLRVIEYRTAIRIPELVSEFDDGDLARTMIEHGDFLGVREQFLTKVRQTIQLISQRSASADTAMDSQAIRGKEEGTARKGESVPLEERQMTGEQKKRIHEALLAAFPDLGSLRRMVSFGLNENLDVIATIGKLNDTVFDLLNWAIARDKIVPMVVAARNSNPENAALRRVAEELHLAPESAQLESIVIPGVGITGVETWREKMSRSELAVCRIELSKSGTGFLISPDAVITNYHVVTDAIACAFNPTSVTLRFDYKTNMNGITVQNGSEFKLANDWLIDSSPADELDYALLRVEGTPGKMPVAGQQDAPDRGWLIPTMHTFTEGEPLFIIQHPRAKPLAVSSGVFITQKSSPQRIIHSVSTLPGSSGSPCFRSDWSLVALHRAGSATGNEAIPFSVILDTLKSRNIMF